MIVWIVGFDLWVGGCGVDVLYVYVLGLGGVEYVFEVGFV